MHAIMQAKSVHACMVHVLGLQAPFDIKYCIQAKSKFGTGMGSFIVDH
jgi:hypothetical protein